MRKVGRSLVSALAGLVALSALPGASRADPGPKNVVFLAARDTTGAKKLVERLEEGVRDNLIWIESYTIVARDARGTLEVKEDWQRKPAAALPPGFGVGMTGLLAVLGGVAGLLVERGDDAGLGFITGSAASRTRKPEWPGAPPVWPEAFDDAVNRLAGGVRPGQTALIAVIEERLPTDGTVVDIDKVRAREQLEREVPVLKTAR
jgi:hypothetical protein